MPFVSNKDERLQTIWVTKARRPMPKPPTPRMAGDESLTSRERELVSVIEQAFARIPTNAHLSFVADQNNPDYRHAVDDALGDAEQAIANALHKEVVRAGKVAAKELRDELATLFRQMYKAKTPSIHTVVSQFAFNVDSVDALNYARREAATLVTNMGTEQVAAMRDLVARSRAAQQTSRQTAGAIRELLQGIEPGTDAGRLVASNLGSNVNGLTVRYEQAVLRHANEQAQRLADRGITGRKALKEVRESTNKYASRLRKARARTISRTEIIRAAEAGRQEAWNQAAAQGLIDPKVATKTWSTGPFDVCPICVELQGTSAPVNGTWPNGLAHPPAHPNCRCTMVLNSYPPSTPPQAVGSGTLDDPYRLVHDTNIPNLDDYPPLGGTNVPAPDPRAPRRTTTEPTAPKPTRAKPTTPSRGTGIGDTVPFDDLRGRIDKYELDGVGGPKLIDQSTAKVWGYEATVTKEGEELLDVVEEAGRRIEVRVNSLLKEAGEQTMDEAAATYDAAADTVRKAQSNYNTHTFDELQELAAKRGLPMLPEEVALGPDAGRVAYGRRIASMDWKDVRTKLKLKASDDNSPSALLDAVMKGAKATPEKTALKAAVDDATKNLADVTNKLKGQAKAQAEAVRKALREVREDFGEGVFDVELKEYGAAGKRIMASVENAQRSLPKTWVEASNSVRPSISGTPGRPVYRREANRVYTSLREPMPSTTLHELTHVVETNSPAVSQANEAFYLRQVRNQKHKVMYPDEIAIEDDFGDLYAGRWYGQGKEMPIAGNFETLNRGLESLFTRDTMEGVFFIDGAYRRFVLGMLGLV